MEPLSGYFVAVIFLLLTSTAICWRLYQWRRKLSLAEKIKQLKEVLYEHNLHVTKRVPVVPLQKSVKYLPIELLYAPVSITEDMEHKHVKKTHVKNYPEGKSVRSRIGDDLEAELDPKSASKPNSKPVRGPSDMFYENGKTARYVFLRGGAGRGKSVYCLRLMQYWCAAKEPGKDKNTLTDWEKGLDEYDFLFRVSLSHVHVDRSSLIDMICHDMFKHLPECHDAIRHVLSNDQYRCLVVIDGLDEWKMSPKAKSELTDGLPNIEGISNTTYFITSRPSKIKEVPVSVRRDMATKIVDIHGLDKVGMKHLIKNVLINFYEMESESSEFKDFFEKIVKKLQKEKVKSLMEIPILLIAFVQLLCEGIKVGDSMTCFYLELVRFLIKKAFDEKETYENVKETLNGGKTAITNLPLILKKNEAIGDFIVVLHSLGDMAYQDLIAQGKNLLFLKDELEHNLGNLEVEFALKVGLLGQSEAPDTGQVCVKFLHESIQEFLAAINIVCRDKIGIESFCSHLTSVEHILGLSNVIMFTSGLSPSLGSILSQHLVGITKIANLKVYEYRETFDRNDNDLRNQMATMYGVQITCFQEMKHSVNTCASADSVQDIEYHVAEVYLDENSDTEIQRVTRQLLCDPHVNIKSVHVNRIDTTARITPFLHDTTSFQHLGINEYDLHQNRDIYLNISDQLHSLKNLHLYEVRLSPDVVYGLQTLLQNNTALQSLTLQGTTCRGESGDYKKITLSLSSMLTSLQCLSIIYLNLSNMIDQLKSLKILHLERVSLSSNVVCGLQKSLQNNTVLQSLTLRDITYRDEIEEDITVPASLCDALRVLPDSLTTLHIYSLKYKEDIMMLVNVLPRLHHLHSVKYYGETFRNAECHAAVAQTLSCMKQLQRLQLYHISLGDRPLELTSEMSQIEKVEIRFATMSKGGWNEFINSLINIPHHFDVILFDTDIDDESRTMIFSSPCFTVTRDDGRLLLIFTRVVPAT